MIVMDTMSTVSEALDKLKREGYIVDFNLDDNCLSCHGNTLKIHPDEFVVDTFYRFEGISDPGDEAVVYAISSTKLDVKGTLVDGYGMYSDARAGDLVKALKEKINVKSAKAPQAAPAGGLHEPARQRASAPLDGPLVEVDLYSFRRQIKQEQTWSSSDRNAITVYKTTGMRIVLVALHQGAEMKTHTAPGIISVQVLEGKIRFTTE